MKKCASNVKVSIKLYDKKIVNNIPKDYNPKKIVDAFDEKYIEYKKSRQWKTFKTYNFHINKRKGCTLRAITDKS